MKHGFRHLIGCFLPIILLFLLPALGISSRTTFTIAIVLMFACHLFMMGGHDHDSSEEDDETVSQRVQDLDRPRDDSSTKKGNS